MTDATQTPEPATLTPDAAKVERGHLMADAAWRGRAMVPNSREFANLQRLDLTIAGVSDEPATDTPEPQGQEQRQERRDGQLALPSHEVPASPSGYELAPVQGLVSDPERETAWRQAMHSAGVDGELAGVAWMVSGDAALRDISPEKATRERDQAQQVLRGRWGGSYDEMMALASQEARRFYAALPATLKAGPGLETYESFMGETGLGRSAMVFQMLAERALKRTGKANA